MYLSILLVLVPLIWFQWGLFVSIAYAITFCLIKFVQCRNIGLTILLLGIGCLALFRLEQAMVHPLPAKFQHSVVDLNVCLTRPPVEYLDYYSAVGLVIEQPDSINLRSIQLSLPKKILSSPLTIGQCILGSFRLRQPIGFVVPGAFLADQYYFASYRDAKASLVNIRETKLSAGLLPRLYLNRKSIFSNPKSLSVWSALIFGWSGNIDSQLKGLLAENQIMHLFVISGMHIGFISSFLLIFVNAFCGLFSRVKNITLNIRYLGVFIITAIYVVAIGCPIPAMRAMFMVFVPLCCFCLGWRISIYHSLIFSALLILAVFPESWLGIGTWLSFISVYFILGIAQHPKFSQLHWILKLVLFQCLMSLSVLPWAFAIGLKFNLWSVLTNLLVTPIVAFLLVPLAFLLVFVPLASGRFIFEWIINLLIQGLSYTGQYSMVMPWVPPVVVIAVVIAVILISYWDDRISLTLLVIIGCPFLVLVVLSVVQFRDPEVVTVTIFDVGHGLAVLYQGPDGEWLYDTAGIYGNYTLFEMNLTRHISDLDGLIVSHSDVDHSGAADYVVTHYEPMMKWSGQPGVENLVENQSDFISCHIKSYITPHMQFIPIPEALRTTDNNNSCILLLNTGFGRLLVTGDADKYIEYYLLQEYPRLFPVDVVILGHHGSAKSSSKAWLDSNISALFVLSTSDRFRPKWPAPRIASWLQANESQLLSTAKLGTIQITFSDAGITYKTWDSAYRNRLIY